MDLAEARYSAGEDASHLDIVLERFPQWTVEATVTESNVGPVVAEIRIRRRLLSREPSRGGRVQETDRTGIHPASLAQREWAADASVPARLLRAINPGELLDIARRFADGIPSKENPQGGSTGAPQGDFATLLRDLSSPAGPRNSASTRPGRRGNPIEHYLQWAIRYVQRVEGGSRTPITDLAHEFRSEGVDRAYVRDTINDARHRYHLLTNPGQGRTGGRLTEKALSLLADLRRDSRAKS